MHKSLEKWFKHKFSSGSTTGEDYKQFQRVMLADLKRQVKASSLELHFFQKSHYNFSAVLRNPENDTFIYISILDVRSGQDRWVNHVLYRNMKHNEDWTGGRNHYCNWEEIGQMALELSSERSMV